MRYTVKTFGIVRDILNGKEVTLDSEAKTVAELKKELYTRYPEMKSLNSMMIAVNHNYAEEDLLLKETDEIALIPPVSGG